MKLAGKLIIYKGEYGYSTLIKNGEDKLYVQVGFRKGQEPTSDKATIDISDGFLSFYRDKQTTAKPKLVILEYQEIEDFMLDNAQNHNTSDEIDDLPF